MNRPTARTFAPVLALALGAGPALRAATPGGPEAFRDFLRDTAAIAEVGDTYHADMRIRRADEEAREDLREAQRAGDLEARCAALGKLMALAAYRGKDVSRIRYARAYVEASDQRSGVGSSRAIEARAEVARRLDERSASHRAAAILRLETAQQVLSNPAGLGLAERARALTDLLRDGDGPDHASLRPFFADLVKQLRGALESCSPETCEDLRKALALAEAESRGEAPGEGR